MIVYVYMYYMLVRLSGCLNHIKGTIIIIITVTLFLGEYARSPKGLKVGDRVKIDVDAERLEELQKERNAWDPELAKVCVGSRHEIVSSLCCTVNWI